MGCFQAVLSLIFLVSQSYFTKALSLVTLPPCEFKGLFLQRPQPNICAVNCVVEI